MALGTATMSVFLTLTFLAHQTLLSADAVLRTFYRRMVSRQRLLEWETAAEAEMGYRQAHLRGCPAELDTGCGVDRWRNRLFFPSPCLGGRTAGTGSLGVQQAGFPVAESSAKAVAEGSHARRTSDSCATPPCTPGVISRPIATRNTTG